MRPNTRRLRELREARGLEVPELAAKVGIDHRTCALYELGRNSERFRYNQLNRLAQFYGVPFDELLEPVPPKSHQAAIQDQAGAA